MSLICPFVCPFVHVSIHFFFLLHVLDIIMFVQCLTFKVNSQGHVSMFRDEAETLILPVSVISFEEYKGMFYMHCPIDKAVHTGPLITSCGQWQEWKVVYI
jgi:hypothetical protein